MGMVTHQLKFNFYLHFILIHTGKQINYSAKTMTSLSILQKYYSELSSEKNQRNPDIENEEEEVEDELGWEVSEAVHMIQPNHIVIWSDDFFNPYYLIKSLTEPNEITDEFCDTMSILPSSPYCCKRTLTRSQ